ncbi:putative Rossmann fold nucleotide-binding protein [Rubidibacter lacunae KORDI 51-2]|uniref:Putative Rossmann fold nucleotide-binding protein n=1 Tax=Rubidibacter lacunae KORDI 51-2 TaxID=582515 RepID=U5DG41_9CHRO|nr:TIGR00725 family protein [Rubidibacter lacunae]ERN40561.1 putative Rossmann fold nucleotide-binding protein [Rubidibacter lacunae KORDI 51-2]
MRRPIVGVMGPGTGATSADCELAFALGSAIARQGWVLLTGGLACGVMDAASRGARAAGGLTVGILPTSSTDEASNAVDIAIATGLGSGRNQINALSSDVLVACGEGLGTLSEVALALKAGKPVVLLGCGADWECLFHKLATDGLVSSAATPRDACSLVAELLQAHRFA